MDLKQLLSLGPPKAVDYIIQHGCDLNPILKQKLTKQDTLKFFSLIADVVSLDTRAEDVLKILALVMGESFMTKISNALQTEEFREDETCSLVGNIIRIFQILYMRMPSASMSLFGVLALLEEHVLKTLKEANLTNEDMLTRLREFRENIEELKKIIINHSVQMQHSKTVRKRVDVRPPPDDFRKIPILPQTSDIFIPGNGKPFLRKNLDKGEFSDLDHYLDVQFRLFREDCISQIRSGIMEYIGQKQMAENRDIRRLQDARLYKRTRVLSSEMTLEGRLHTIQLDPFHASKIKWKTGNRLLYGSLICLSPDDFQTLYFGVVMESDREKLIKEHTFKVQFSFGKEMVSIPTDTPITIVESTAFFEAYRHVLTCLQKIQPGQLPFERYIVQCKTDVQPPAYVYFHDNCFYDFYSNMAKQHIDKEIPIEEIYSIGNLRLNLRLNRLLLEKAREEMTNKYAFDILNGKWPSADQLHLDESQYEAFKAALSQEFVLIQGPPGTGKTYLGLEVAKALLRNRKVWSRHQDMEQTRVPIRRRVKDTRTYPMLIVCYTNHALDQFLEGIMDFMNVSKDNAFGGNFPVVRVGSRCENEKIEPFALKNLRRRTRKYIDYDGLRKRMEDSYFNMMELKFEMQHKPGVVFDLQLLSEASITVPFKTVNQLYAWLGVTEQKMARNNQTLIYNGRQLGRWNRQQRRYRRHLGSGTR